MGHLGELLFPTHSSQVKSPIITDLLYDRNWQVTHKGWTPGAQSAGRVVEGCLSGRPHIASHPFEASREPEEQEVPVRLPSAWHSFMER